ncbi:hypothetical protein EYF80_067839 [Liparis tanakae]|uniref:Uncharacterized protein n=1 Tax=Liparis tanakae TaxID=230148 RepID=A0A4Z2E013_9TELE|nr:hypothetical protein EYF80_067839 [Liparis tanakae]
MKELQSPSGGRVPGGGPAASPGDEHRRVVVRDAGVGDGVPRAAAVLDVLLPLTEAVQRLACVVVDLQGRLEKTEERRYSFKYVFKS